MTLNDLEWPFCVKFCFAQVYMFGALKPGFRRLATLKLVRCCRRTLNRKEQLRHRAVSLQQHGFLVLISRINPYDVEVVLFRLHVMCVLFMNWQRWARQMFISWETDVHSYLR